MKIVKPSLSAVMFEGIIDCGTGVAFVAERLEPPPQPPSTNSPARDANAAHRKPFKKASSKFQMDIARLSAVGKKRSEENTARPAKRPKVIAPPQEPRQLGSRRLAKGSPQERCHFFAQASSKLMYWTSVFSSPRTTGRPLMWTGGVLSTPGVTPSAWLASAAVAVSADARHALNAAALSPALAANAT